MNPLELNELRQGFQVFPWNKPEWKTYEDHANTKVAAHIRKAQPKKEDRAA